MKTESLYNRGKLHMATLRTACLAFASVAVAIVACQPAFSDDAPPIPDKYKNGVVAGMFCGTGVISYCDANSTEGKGILADLNKAWAKEVGIPIKIEGQTWEALLPSAVSWRTDMVAGVGDLESRRGQFNFVDLFANFNSILVAAGNPLNVKGWEDLCGKKMSTSAGSGEEQAIHAADAKYCGGAGKAPIIVNVYGEQQATFMSIQAKRDDATVTDQFGAAELIKQNPDVYALAFKQPADTLWGAAVPVANKELLDMVVYGVKKGLASGSLKAVLDGYGFGDIIVDTIMVNGKPVQ
jgi:polar amino acid transport system substrate-binding protein